MRRRLIGTLAILALLAAISGPSMAEPMRIEALMTPKEQMRLDFADGSKHFVLLVRREGVAEGSGPLAGAAVREFGMHDITPGVGGEPRGYLELSAGAGNVAYLKWQVLAVFVPGSDGKPQLLDNGVWQVVGGAGSFAGLSGAGTLHIKAAGPSDRRFILEGELVSSPRCPKRRRMI